MIEYLASIETKIVAKNKQIFREQRELDICRRNVAPTDQDETIAGTSKVESSQVVSASQQQSTLNSFFETSGAYARAKYDYEHHSSYNWQKETSESRHYGMRQSSEYDDRRERYYYRPSPCYYDDRDHRFPQRFFEEPFPHESFQLPPRPNPQQYPAHQPQYYPQRIPQQYPPQQYSQRSTHPQGSAQQKCQQETPWQHQTPQQPHQSTQQQTPQQTPTQKPSYHSNQQQTPQLNPAPLQSPHSNQQQTPQQKHIQLQSQHPNPQQTPFLHHEQVYLDTYEFESRRGGPEFEYRRERGSGIEPMAPGRSGQDFAKQQENYYASEHAPEEDFFEPFVRQTRRDTYYENNQSSDRNYYQNPNYK